MPKDHARKKTLADLKSELSIKHSCAIALLEHPDADERDTLVEYLETYVDINTYREAVNYLRQEQNAPRNQVMCRRCGWTWGMICPECSEGCGCSIGCTGWRHDEYAHEDDDPDRNVYCRECGAGSSSPYDECTCWEDDEDQEHEPAPAPSPEPLELPYPGGWGSRSGSFPTSGWGS